MKRIMFVLGTVLLAASAITLSSFSNKSFKKNAFAIVCYYYTVSNKALIGHFQPPPNPDRSDYIEETPFKTTTNWKAVTTTPLPPITANGGDCNDGNFVCAICFEDAGTGSYTLSTAIAAAWAYYVAQTPNDFTHGANISTTGSDLRIYLQSSATNNH